MKIYFDNDGSYGKDAINIPVLISKKPVGCVSEITPERVTCYLWDRFIRINKEQVGVNKKTAEQDIRSINFEVL